VPSSKILANREEVSSVPHSSVLEDRKPVS
jgi:hypothetical protein